MSISAIASAWTWPTSTDPSLTASNSQTASTFQASLAQWEQNSGSATQSATSGQTQPDQTQGANGTHHHHHHGLQTDGGEQSGGSSIQTVLSSLVNDIADALQANGSGTASNTPTASAAAAQSAGSTQSATGTQTASTGNASIQAAANTLVADIAQAMQAYSTSTPNTGTSAVVL